MANDSVTRDEPGNPKAVGKSTTHRGEDVVKKGKEPGRYDAGTQADRGIGKSTPRDQTGVDPQKDKN